MGIAVKYMISFCLTQAAVKKVQTVKKGAVKKVQTEKKRKSKECPLLFPLTFFLLRDKITFDI